MGLHTNWDGRWGAETGREAARRVGVRPGFNHEHGNAHLTTITGGHIKFQVNQKYAGNFQGFLRALEDRGYKFSSDSYGFADRDTKFGTPSQHAHGNAIDINPGRNRDGWAGRNNNLPSDVGRLAAQFGLSWGGYMERGRAGPDVMHFEYHPNHGVKPMTLAEYHRTKTNPAPDKGPVVAAHTTAHPRTATKAPTVVAPPAQVAQTTAAPSAAQQSSEPLMQVSMAGLAPPAPTAPKLTPEQTKLVQAIAGSDASPDQLKHAQRGLQNSERRTLHPKGNTKKDLENFQQVLKDAGFYTGEIDGIGGRHTKAAARAFRRDLEIVQPLIGANKDGIIGPETIKQAKLAHEALKQAARPPALGTQALPEIPRASLRLWTAKSATGETSPPYSPMPGTSAAKPAGPLISRPPKPMSVPGSSPL